MHSNKKKGGEESALGNVSGDVESRGEKEKCESKD